MKTIKFTVLILAVITAVIINAAQAQDGSVRKMTLADCIAHALKKSPAAVNARRDEDIAESQVIQARSTALPNVMLSGSYVRLDELQEIEFGSEKMDFGTLENYLVKAEINQPIYSGGKVAAAIRAAAKTRSYAGFARLDRESILVRDVKLAFNNLLLQKEVVKVYESSLDQLMAVKSQVEKKNNSGAASEYDLLRAKVSVANEKPVLVSARNAYDIQLNAFLNLLNIDDDSIELDGTLTCEPVKVDSRLLGESALVNRPMLSAMNSALGLRKENVIATKASYKPVLSAYANYSGANSYQFVAFEEAWEWHWNVGLSLTWSIIDGGLTRGRVREQQLEYEKSLTDYEDMMSSVKLQVRQAVLNLKHSSESIAAGEGNIAVAEKALQIAQARYDSGLADYIEFTEANLALSRAKLFMLRSVCAYRNALAELEYATGLSEKQIMTRKDNENEN